MREWHAQFMRKFHYLCCVVKGTALKRFLSFVRTDQPCSSGSTKLQALSLFRTLLENAEAGDWRSHHSWEQQLSSLADIYEGA
jgi:hypothetical protein